MAEKGAASKKLTKTVTAISSEEDKKTALQTAR